MAAEWPMNGLRAIKKQERRNKMAIRKYFTSFYSIMEKNGANMYSRIS